MRCCRCGEEMLVVEYARVEIDYCADCGIWLDRGELDLILGETGETESGGEETVSPPEGPGEDKPIRCPVCHGKMRKGPYDELARPVVDRCPKGHGIWLDRGELGEIVETRTSGDTSGHEAVISFLSNLFGKEEA